MNTDKTRKKLKDERHLAAVRSRTMRASLAPKMDQADFAERMSIVRAVASASARLAERFAAQADRIDEVRRARALAQALGAAAELADTFGGEASP